MAAFAQGVALQLRDKPATPNKKGVVVGVSLTVSLRTIVVYVYRYDAGNGVYVPLENYPITLVLTDSQQQVVFLTNALGRADNEFPDANIEVRLSPGSMPVGHTAVLNYVVRVRKRADITVTFLPDSLVRHYPNQQAT